LSQIAQQFAAKHDAMGTGMAAASISMFIAFSLIATASAYGKKPSFETKARSVRPRK
jgi:hypothetical protein